jgi:hypothetical protein
VRDTTLMFPPDAVECRQGDYLVQRLAAGTWSVARVDDLVALSRLIPFEPRGSREVIEEAHVRDSVRPAWDGEIHLLVTAFPERFGSEAEAVAAIRSGELGDGVSPLCLSAAGFSQSDTRVHEPGAA